MTRLRTMITDALYQGDCHECYCDIWYVGDKYLHCPHCGAKLNECSSEDANDGVFTDLTEYDSVDGAATEPITKGERS